MNLDTAFPSKYLRADDLRDGFSEVLIIDRFSMESLKDPRTNVEEMKPILYFRRAEKGLVLNVTNKNALKMMFGTADSDQMIGKEVELFKTQVAVGRELKNAMRLRAPSTNDNASRPAPPAAGAPPAADPDPGGDPFGSEAFPQQSDDDIPF